MDCKSCTYWNSVRGECTDEDPRYQEICRYNPTQEDEIVIRCIGCDRELDAKGYTRNGVRELHIGLCPICSKLAVSHWLREQSQKLEYEEIP